MNRSLVSLAVTIVTALSVAASDWPMFGRDASHCSATADAAPLNLNAAEVTSSSALGLKQSSTPIVVNGKVYVYAAGSPSGTLFCLDAVTLGVVWSNAVGVDDSGLGSWATPAVSQGFVVFGADDFLGCWTTGGVPVWAEEITPAMNSSPVITGNKVLIGSFHYSNRTNAVAAYSLTNGACVWQKQVVPASFSSCTPAVKDGIGYACSSSNIWAFDCATGSNVWSVSLPCTSLKNVSLGSNTILAVNYDVFASGPQTNLFALDPTTGTQLWAKVCGGTDVPPAVWNNVVIHACGDNATAAALTAFDLNSGSQLWARAGIGNSANMPAVANGVVYASAGLYDAWWTLVYMTNLSAVSATDGTVLSKRAAAEGGYSAAIADGSLFSANNGVLSKFTEPLTIKRLAAKIQVVPGIKDSIAVTAYCSAGPSITHIAGEPVTLRCGDVMLLSNTVGEVTLTKAGMKWEHKAGTLTVKMNWSAAKHVLTLNARLNKATLTGMLPYSSADGAETNTVYTSLCFGSYRYYAESSKAVSAKTKRGTATLNHER